MTLSVTFKEKLAMWLAKYSTSKEKKIIETTLTKYLFQEIYIYRYICGWYPIQQAKKVVLDKHQVHTVS